MELDDLEHMLNHNYYSDERREELDPSGTYLLAFAVVELVKELRALRVQLDRTPTAQQSGDAISG